jgi:predicted nucleic acid-binding Zn ribbon protein
MSSTNKTKKCIVCGKPIKDVVYLPVTFENDVIQEHLVRRDFPFCSVECLEHTRATFQAQRKSTYPV